MVYYRLLPQRRQHSQCIYTYTLYKAKIKQNERKINNNKLNGWKRKRRVLNDKRREKKPLDAVNAEYQQLLQNE